jgi:hypothetical protein
MRVLFMICGAASLIGAGLALSGLSMWEESAWTCTTYAPSDENDNTTEEYCTMEDQLQTDAIDMGLMGIGFQLAAIAVSLGPTRRETQPLAQPAAAPPPAHSAQPYGGPAAGNPGWGPAQQQAPQQRPPGA